MTETKWTPGPWAMPDVEIGIISKFISPGRWDGMIATADCGNYARSRSEGLANANLISAAPDLYTATDWVDSVSASSQFEYVYVRLSVDELNALIDARRKARGE